MSTDRARPAQSDDVMEGPAGSPPPPTASPSNPGTSSTVTVNDNFGGTLTLDGDQIFNMC